MQKISPKAAQSEGANWFGDAAPSYVFRPVHYLGSKLRVLDSIERAIDGVDTTGGPVCDLFSGSATVSRYLSRRRQVMSVDIQEYGPLMVSAFGTTQAAVRMLGFPQVQSPLS